MERRVTDAGDREAGDGVGDCHVTSGAGVAGDDDAPGAAGFVAEVAELGGVKGRRPGEEQQAQTDRLDSRFRFHGVVRCGGCSLGAPSCIRKSTTKRTKNTKEGGALELFSGLVSVSFVSFVVDGVREGRLAANRSCGPIGF
ncbi:MAG: hypothetical protein HS113_04000 [Verrucomicrobiales bacterium]|nr:hypothetical protein [Verrucomicrobiales bacterium]